MCPVNDLPKLNHSSCSSTFQFSYWSGLARLIHVRTNLPQQPRIHGEQVRAQENFSQSSHAYDRSVLLKMGKPPSPQSRHQTRPLEAPSRKAHKLSLHTRSARPPASPRDRLSADTDSISRWMTSPTSTAVSPASRSG